MRIVINTGKDIATYCVGVTKCVPDSNYGEYCRQIMKFLGLRENYMKNLENLSQRSISLKMQLYWSKLKRNKPKLAGRLYVKNVIS